MKKLICGEINPTPEETGRAEPQWSRHGQGLPMRSPSDVLPDHGSGWGPVALTGGAA